MTCTSIHSRLGLNNVQGECTGEETRFSLVVRAHQPKELGFQLWTTNVLKIFSSASYCSSSNAGKLMAC